MLSYSLVLALFLLGPGFTSYAGVFFGLRGGPFLAAPPPPNSIFSFAVIGLSALFWHAVWAASLALDQAACAHAACLRVPFDPNVYVAALAATRPASAAPTGPQVAAFLCTCLWLSVAAFFGSAGLVRAPVIAELLRRPLYGLYADLAREVATATRTRPEAYVMAYVLTTLEREGGFLGYVGALENLQAGADRQVASVSLVDCDTFLLQLGPPVQRTAGQREQLIDRVVIDGGRVQNIAFEIVQPG